MTTELAKGKTLKEAERINQKTVLNALEGLPKEHEHCAHLALTCLNMALANYL